MTSRLRFLVVGGACALLHNVIMIGGDFIGLHYAISNTVSFAIVVATGYTLHLVYTFRERASFGSFVRYVVGLSANYPLSLAAMSVFVDVAALAVWAAAPLATAVLVIWNFMAARWAIVQKPAA